MPSLPVIHLFTRLTALHLTLPEQQKLHFLQHKYALFEIVFSLSAPDSQVFDHF